jgi:natural product precursor
MKKIKLDSGKLKLKKESIGNLLNAEAMKHIVGGYGASDLSPTCQCPSNACPSNPPACVTWDQTAVPCVIPSTGKVTDCGQPSCLVYNCISMPPQQGC